MVIIEEIECTVVRSEWLGAWSTDTEGDRLRLPYTGSVEGDSVWYVSFDLSLLDRL